MHTIAHSLSVCVVVVNRANTAQSNCNVQYLGRIKRKKEANNVFYITIIERVQFEMLCQIKVPRRERLNLSKQSKKKHDPVLSDSFSYANTVSHTHLINTHRLFLLFFSLIIINFVGYRVFVSTSAVYKFVSRKFVISVSMSTTNIRVKKKEQNSKNPNILLYSRTVSR